MAQRIGTDQGMDAMTGVGELVDDLAPDTAVAADHQKSLLHRSVPLALVPGLSSAMDSRRDKDDP